MSKRLTGWGNIDQQLATRWLGRTLYYYPSLASTNDTLQELAVDGVPAGATVLADYQSSGRGRLKRRWEAPSGSSLLCSVLFRPRWPAQQANWLTMLAGLAARDAIEEVTGLSIGLKWPNDIVVQICGEWRKLGGLLQDNSFSNGTLVRAILGAGINVNIPADQLPETTTPATSLLLASGRSHSRLILLTNYLNRLECGYMEADEGLSPLNAWKDQLVTLGSRVSVSGGGLSMPIEGEAEDVDESGHLLVRDKQGRQHSIAAGDVTLRV